MFTRLFMKAKNFNLTQKNEKCCKLSTPKQVKKNSLNRIFEIKRWETHALLGIWKILGKNDGILYYKFIV